jgi:DNA (cytosine-5)-methyltransferase 1
VRSEQLLMGSHWQRLKNKPITPKCTNPLSVADLFCGCGGLTLGATEAARSVGRAIEVRYAIDSASLPLDVYRDNFDVSHSAYSNSKIEEVLPGGIGERLHAKEKKLAKEIGDLDLVVAGPPCQGHSDLNNNSRRNDGRNELYMRVVRFAEITTPQVVLIENVPSVIHDRKRVVSRASEALCGLGYHVAQLVVDFAKLGLAQTRRRHVLVATRGPYEFPTIGLTADPQSLENVIDDLVDESDSCSTMFGTPSRMTATNRERVAYMFNNGLFDLPDSQRPPCDALYQRLRDPALAEGLTKGEPRQLRGREEPVAFWTQTI